MFILFELFVTFAIHVRIVYIFLKPLAMIASDAYSGDLNLEYVVETFTDFDCEIDTNSAEDIVLKRKLIR